MKTKSSNKFNNVLIAITLLLLFVLTFGLFGKTNSWLETKQDISFILKVPDINIIIKQDERTVADEGYIYLGTDHIEGDKDYALNVTITNGETGTGYYIRFQAFAVINGVTYNINNCITSDFYNRGDGWFYSVDDNTAQSPTNQAMAGGQVLTMMEKVKFPSSLIESNQGQFFKLHLFVEGSASGEFTTI